jgi:hypothetical protein
MSLSRPGEELVPLQKRQNDEENARKNDLKDLT